MHTANIIYIERQFGHTCNNPQYSGVKVQGGTLHKFTSSCLSQIQFLGALMFKGDT